MMRHFPARHFPNFGRYCRCPVCGYEEEKGIYGFCERIRCPYCGSALEEY